MDTLDQAFIAGFIAGFLLAAIVTLRWAARSLRKF